MIMSHIYFPDISFFRVSSAGQDKQIRDAISNVFDGMQKLTHIERQRERERER